MFFTCVIISSIEQYPLGANYQTKNLFHLHLLDQSHKIYLAFTIRGFNHQL